MKSHNHQVALNQIYKVSQSETTNVTSGKSCRLSSVLYFFAGLESTVTSMAISKAISMEMDCIRVDHYTTQEKRKCEEIQLKIPHKWITKREGI